jgi:hypothetical protein
MNSPRLIQTYLPDGTLEGVRIIEPSESSIKAFVVPRIKINDVKDRKELKHPSFYLLISSGDNQIYIGESENFFDRIKNHDQNKDFWDIAVAIVSKSNDLEKSDIKYLESLTVERAKATAAMEVLNKTIPTRNNVHEFKVHSLETILDDLALIVESLGYSLFTTTKSGQETVWHCKSKKTTATAQFRGDKFVILSGSIIDKSHSSVFENYYQHALTQRLEIFEKYGNDRDDTVELLQNVPFNSPNSAGGFAVGRSVNAWTLWKDAKGRTMDEVIRKGSA